MLMRYIRREVIIFRVAFHSFENKLYIISMYM